MNSDRQVNDVWESMNKEEKERRNEYKTRYRTIKTSSDFTLTSLMSNHGDLDKNKSKMKTSSNSNTITSSEKIRKHRKQDKTHKDDSSTSSNHESSYSDPNTMIQSSPTIIPLIIPLQSISSSISKLVIGLNSNESTIRRKSLSNLIQQVFITNKLSEHDYNILFHDICKSIFRLFADTVEKCRELSLQVTLLFFQHSMDFVPILGYFFPCLMQRLPVNIGYDEELKIFVYGKLIP